MGKNEYNFSVDRIGYVVRFSNDGQLSFFTPHSNFDPFEKWGTSTESYNDLGLSGVSALKVFREVGRIAVNHIKKYRMNYVWFTCVPSRSSLYIRLAKHLSDEVGLKVTNVKNTEFYLSK